MKIDNIRAEHIAGQPRDYPDEILPEFAFLGRSNVGKSSLINSLVNRRNLARTSKTPGKTRAIHWYRLSGGAKSCYFVDLPGYGYAKVPKDLRQHTWARLITTYLESGRPSVLAFQLLDIRRQAPTELDQQMIRWLRRSGVPHLFVLTKADKLGHGKRQHAIRTFSNFLQLPAQSPPIAYSSFRGFGKQRLWSAIDHHLAVAA